MSLPTPAKTWQFAINQTLAAPASGSAGSSALMYAIKQSLIGFASSPWVVLYSCNSTTAGTAGDGVDRWSSAANVVLGGNASAHSWIVLKQAGMGAGNYQIVISASDELTATAPNTTYNTISIIESKNAGFTGGSTTTRPTATDEIVICNYGATGGGQSLGAWGGTLTSAARRLHVLQSTDGACTYIIVCAGGVAWAAFVLAAPALRISSGWSNPTFAASISSASASSVYPLAAGTLSQATPSAGVGRALIGSTAARLTLTCEGNSSSLAPADTTYGNVANELSGEWPIYPIGVTSPTAGVRGSHATMVDLWFGSSARSTGDTYDASSLTFAQFGNLIVPWDGSSVPGVS